MSGVGGKPEVIVWGPFVSGEPGEGISASGVHFRFPTKADIPYGQPVISFGPGVEV